MKRHLKRAAQRLGLTKEKRLALPHEPGEWVEVVRPSAVVLDLAREQKVRELKRQLELMLPLLTSLPAGTVTVQEGPAWQDPLEGFDLLTLLQRCVVAWSYDEPVNNTNLGQLDERSAMFIARELLRLVGIRRVRVELKPEGS